MRLICLYSNPKDLTHDHNTNHKRLTQDRPCKNIIWEQYMPQRTIARMFKGWDRAESFNKFLRDQGCLSVGQASLDKNNVRNEGK